MASQVRRLKIAVTLTVVASLAFVVLVPSSSTVGILLKEGPEGLPLPHSDSSVVPQSIAADATRLAASVYGASSEAGNDFANQLLATYLKVKDEDFVIIFNSGGWGWNILEASPQWTSIFLGIQSELADLGYTSLSLNYQRATDTTGGYFAEFMSMISLYPSQANDLASKIEFLIKHIANIRVIVIGESTGTIIADSVMSILRDHPQVYSIQTGPPFWHKNLTLERTLVIRSNEVIPDSFSQGDLLVMLVSTLESLFGFPQEGDNTGKILLYMAAPGHEYWWQHPGVHSQITNFLQHNFGVK